MSPTTIKLTREQLIERRSSVVERLDISLSELRNRIAHGSLAGDEWYAAEDISEIDFLLGGGDK